MTFFGRFRRRRTPPQAHVTQRHVDVVQRARQGCERCNATAKAIRYVQDLWVVAGIDRE